MAIVGYARVSTTDQDLEAQLQQLKEAKCDQIFEEKESGAKTDRPVLAEMLRYVRRDDVVVVCKLDRIARSTKHLLEILELLESQKIPFRVLNINLDTGTATGKLMLTVLGAIATFEREMMLERQAEGIKIAKSRGVYTGRQPTARKKSDRVLELLALGRTKQSVADELRIGVASVYRIVAENKKSQNMAP